jgi:hypothetical protein
MTTPLLQDWTDDQRRAYRREIVVFQNRLGETGLFTDEALARLIERHPRDRLDVLTMGRDKTDPDSWAAGDWEHLSGAELIEAVKRGRLWANVRGAMLTDPEYRAVFDRLLTEFQAQTRGPRVLKASAGVLISSPGVQVFYHCDRTDTMLWHLRGEKTIYLWPTTETFVSERDYEKLILKETKEDLPYRAEFDEAATVIKMTPGTTVSWPLHGPHRVENGDSMNVSVTIEYSTADSTLTNSVFFTHGVLRRRLGLNLKSRRVPGALKPAYFAAARLLRPLAPKIDAYKAHGRTFDVDLTAPECTRWKPGHGPRVAGQDRAAA